MLAAIQSGIDEVDVRDIAVPTRTDAALVRVRAAGICGSDLHRITVARSGTHSLRATKSQAKWCSSPPRIKGRFV